MERSLFRADLTERGPIPGLPAVIVYMPQFSQSCSLEAGEDHPERAVLTQTPAFEIDYANTHEVFGDPEALRDALESVKTPEEARIFLERCGPWLPPETVHQKNSFGQRKALTWDDFQRWQMHFRDRRQGYRSSRTNLLGIFEASPAKLDRLQGEIRPFGTQKCQHLAIWIECSCAVEAISSLIELEQTLGIEYRVCAFQGCQKFFKVGHRKEKKCCDDICLHANGQRRRRSRKSKVAGPLSGEN